jgi:4'-phosphopantetheinyl transferase EntD
MPLQVAFRLPLAHGRCVGVRIPAELDDSDLAGLCEEERNFLGGLAPARRPSWLCGRVALHLALADAGVRAGPILQGKRGAPDVPAEAVGSISHKRTLAVGLAAERDGDGGLGVDLEVAPPPFATEEDARADKRPDIRKHVLTPDELAVIGAWPVVEQQRRILLHFSFKEAFYKAINGMLGRYVSFQEASVHPHPDGTARFDLALQERTTAWHTDARWTEVEGHFLTSVKVRPQL